MTNVMEATPERRKMYMCLSEETIEGLRITGT